MSKLARVLVLGAMVAVMTLAGTTAVAHAQANDEGKNVRRPSTQGQVGETWRKRPVTSQQQAAADTALRRQLAQEHSSIPSGTPAQVPAPTQAGEPSGQSGWLVASLGVLAAVLVLAGVLAVLAARRAGRKVRPGHAA